MYESVMLFRRLQAQAVENYDFVNGAPAVGATLDLAQAPEAYRLAYAGRRPERDLHHYFTQVSLPNIRFPQRPYYTTNDPVMSPELLDRFFNRQTRGFEQLNQRQRRLLRAIYPEASYRAVLPEVSASSRTEVRQHRRFSLKCPATWHIDGEATQGGSEAMPLEVIDASREGFLARSATPLSRTTCGSVQVNFSEGRHAQAQAVVVRRLDMEGGSFHGFKITAPSPVWDECIAELEAQDTPPSAYAGCECGSDNPDRIARSQAQTPSALQPPPASVE